MFSIAFKDFSLINKLSENTVFCQAVVAENRFGNKYFTPP